MEVRAMTSVAHCTVFIEHFERNAPSGVASDGYIGKKNRQ